ncbi:MAG: branched-chain amino acid ABC transporter permease [Bacillati bacterium ANGP1]|uniref:Branched-chain amino acid ABC transporter permease n=1 Tax=Candidatus Segetimicrobium genomatis TaxID=2569760 RepID=A0A537M842_9BACT|nr:MAG: branched-chain amino acid ABC transporter permease [Terrabacteria group bacterium ANGP1]
MFSAENLIAVGIAAVLTAGLYAIMSYGLAIIYGVMRVINLSHAGFLMLGAFMTLVYFQRWHLDPVLAGFVNLPVFFVAGVLVYRVLVRRVTTSLPIASLLLLFGLWLVIQNLAVAVWGGEDQSIITSYTYKALTVFGFRIPVTRLIVFGVALAVLGVLHFVLGHTYMGKALRATVQDPTAGLLVGIDTERVSAAAFGLGTAFAAFAGSLLTLLFSFNPDFGGAFQLKSFTIIVLGGLENFAGVTVGAAVLAFAESYAVLFMRASLQNVIAYALLVAALIVMPGGIGQLLHRRT